MKIVIIGSSGTVGRAVTAELSARHDIVTASRTGADIVIDLGDEASVKAGLAAAAPFDAVVSCAGQAIFKPLTEMSATDYLVGLTNKVMGQINLIRHGLAHMTEGGSFTLTAGVLASDPISGGSGASVANGALESFTRAAAIDLPAGYRINTVSATVLASAFEAYFNYFPGVVPVDDAVVARAYAKSVEGHQTGQVYAVL